MYGVVGNAAREKRSRCVKACWWEEEGERGGKGKEEASTQTGGPRGMRAERLTSYRRERFSLHRSAAWSENDGRNGPSAAAPQRSAAQRTAARCGPASHPHPAARGSTQPPPPHSTCTDL